MNAKQKKLKAALDAWIESKNADEPNPAYKPLADVHVRMEDGALTMFYDGSGYDCLSYQASYGGIFREEVFAIAKKHGFYSEDHSSYALSFYED